MKTNKGYSLAELLVSLAIFSIVMLSIVTIMRNASISYRNENAEVQLQENSQLLLSQMEELLVDCKSVTPSGVKTWNIVDSHDVTHTIKLEGNTVQYKYGSSGFEELASNVSDIKINGLQSANGDDRCTVVVEMVNTIDGNSGGKEYTYSTSKDIVFRNASVEKSPNHDDSFLNGGGGGPITPPSPNTVNVEMGRYELLNLISDYDIDTSKAITISGDTTAYNFVDPSGLDSNNYMASITRMNSGTSGYLTTSTTCNSATSSSYSCVVTGTTNANKSITLNITTPAVKLVKGTGLVYAPIGAINNGSDKNYYSFIEIDGLNVRDAKQYFGVDCSGKLRFSNSLNNNELSGTVFSAASDWSNGSSYGNISAPGGMSSATGLGYDPYSKDVLTVMFSSKLYESPYDGNQWWTPPASEIAARQAKIDTFNNAGYTVKVTITYPSGLSTASSDETYKVYITSANLSNL